MSSEAWKGGSTRAWRQLRKRILDRDGHICQIRHEDCCTHEATAVHHLDGKAAGDDPTRLVACCRPCNDREGDPTKNRSPQPKPWQPL